MYSIPRASITLFIFPFFDIYHYIETERTNIVFPSLISTFLEVPYHLLMHSYGWMDIDLERWIGR